MEGLIMMIIIAVISSVLGKGKKTDEPTKQMPPFSNQEVPREWSPVEPKQQRPKVKSLEDFANEVFGQLNEKVEPKKQVVREVKEEPVRPVVQEFVRKERTSTRPELGATRPIVQQAKKSSFNVVPQTQQQLMQAIVTSEILGPPKAKQRK
mgnify:CR=1 FL=1